MKKSKVTINAEFETEKPSEAIRAISIAIDEAKTGINSSFEGTVKEIKDTRIGFHKKD